MPGFDLQQMGGGILSTACHPGEKETPTPGDHPRPGNTQETARKYRFRFQTLEPLDKESLLLFAYRITRPAPEIDQITIHNGQTEIYRPGKNRWLPIEISFYERVLGESGEGVDKSGGYDQPAALIYNWWAQVMINLNTSLHGEPGSYRKPAEIVMLDGIGNSIWTYYLVNSWPLKVYPGDLSYLDTEIADITLTLSYDKAVEKGGI